jgi:hypothetical protein
LTQRENMDEESKLFEILKISNQNRIDYNIRKWETIKFTETIFSGLIITTIGAVIAASNYNLLKNWLIVVGIIIIPLCTFFLLYLGYENLKRESKLLFKEEATLLKILNSLHLNENVKNFLWDGEFYRDQRYLEIESIKNIFDYRQYIDKRLEIHLFLKIFRKVLIIESSLSVLLIIVIIINYIK